MIVILAIPDQCKRTPMIKITILDLSRRRLLIVIPEVPCQSRTRPIIFILAIPDQSKRSPLIITPSILAQSRIRALIDFTIPYQSK